jgi:hypothetical protein
MSLLEQLKELAQFDYLKGERYTVDSSIFYQFGWKEGLHFYLDDYYENDEHEERYILVIWLNKEMKLCEDFREREPLIETIKEFLK